VSAIRVLLEQHGVLGGFRRQGHRLFGPCPVHGGDNPRAFVVDLRGDRWYCFTRCRRGGGPRGLAREFGRDVPEHRVVVKPERPFVPYRRRLRLQSRHPWLQAKGIRPTTAREWDVGAWTGTGMLSGCLAVRQFDLEGGPLGYAGRRLDPDAVRARGKWVFPPRLPKSTLLYGLHRVVGEGAIVVTECSWGVLRLFQLGIPAVGLLGVGLSASQRQALRRFHRVVALLDGDVAGRAGATFLVRHLSAVVATLPDGADPDDLTDHQLKVLLFPLLM
jgi:DNA primase